MVNELQFSKSTVYLCEVCGYGYRKLETAEHCEQHCDTELRSSAKIRRKAVYQPKVEVIPIASPHPIQRLTASTLTLRDQMRRTQG